jgi:hypothetical protein
LESSRRRPRLDVDAGLFGAAAAPAPAPGMFTLAAVPQTPAGKGPDGLHVLSTGALFAINCPTGLLMSMRAVAQAQAPSPGGSPFGGFSPLPAMATSSTNQMAPSLVCAKHAHGRCVYAAPEAVECLVPCFMRALHFLQSGLTARSKMRASGPSRPSPLMTLRAGELEC